MGETAIPTVPINSQEIFKLIKACKQFGVSSIKVDSLGLEVTFSDKDVSKPFSVKKNIKVDPLLEKHLGNEASREREFQLSQIDIEDPYMYEQIILSNSEKEFINAKAPDIGS